jgi:2-isopropylmalate synthase
MEHRLCIGQPFRKESSELAYHRDGPGQRWVLMDDRVDARSSFYVMCRMIAPAMPRLDEHSHVDTHSHHCDSAIIFMGFEADGSGLSCEMTIGDNEATVESPASVFVPKAVPHTYRYIEGWGTVLNVVLNGNYNDSIV